ncbi:MAG: hypothetical protein KDD69_13515 [Bdellovibrionales bacterium]|nr:hypothetical protein [Bdellovibrionales bacterium]
MSIISRIGLVGSLVATAFGAISCGSGSSNNDQGTSVTAIAYFAEDPDEPGVFPCDQAQSGAILPLFEDINVVDGRVGTDSYTSFGIQNMLAVQTFRVTRIDCSYSIPGSSIQVPNSSIATGIVLAPVETGEDGGDQFAQFSCIPFPIVPPEIYSFVNNNQNSMPQLPFRMNVLCSATGVTQAGDTLTTNPLGFDVQFVDFAEGLGINGPFDQGPGTGGNVVFEGDSEGPDGETGAASEAQVDGSVAGDDFVIE